MKKPLVLVGSRNMLSELAVIAELNGIEILGILDCHYYNRQDTICNIPVIGDERWLLNDDPRGKIYRETCDFFPANYHDGEQRKAADNMSPSLEDMHGLASVDLRLKRINLLDTSGVNVINLVHPDASVRGLTAKHANYKIGRGVQIHSGCIHQVDSVDIGDYCAFQPGSTVAHHVKIGRNTLVSPNTFLHNCTIGENSVVGIYSRINIIPKKKETISIGNNVTIWHSAEIIDDIPDNHMFTSNGRTLRKLRG